MERNREFSSAEEAFSALAEPVKAHSLRVEKYADLIFMELCAAEEYTININSRVRLRTDNRTLIGLAARYHDLGKVLVPEFYQLDRPDYTPEERALYARHCLAGDELAHTVFRDQKGVVPMTVDVICESIAYHHERWDGEGFPHATSEEHTPIVGRIVAVADAMDKLLMNIRSETPVNTVIENMMMDSGSIYDPVIMGLLYDARPKIERIFAAYRRHSRAIPQAPRVIRRKKRPMWLEYRPIVDLRSKKVMAVEADMRFKQGKTNVTYKEAEPLLRKTKQVYDAGMSFVIEACDTARRMKTCGVGGRFVALNTVAGFFKKRGMSTTLLKMFADTETDAKKLAFVLSAEDVLSPSAAVTENCTKLSAAGCSIVCSGVSLEQLEPKPLKKLGINHVMLPAEDIGRMDGLAGKLQRLADAEIIVIGSGLELHRQCSALVSGGVKYGVGNIMGEYISEDDLILGELALTE